MDFVVEHKPGRTITHADAMSRPPQESEQVLLTVTSNDRGRLKVVPTDRKEILELYHDSADSGSHDGIWRTYFKVSKRFCWPRMKDDVTAYVKSCLVRQKKKCENAEAVISLLQQKAFKNTKICVSDHARVFESKKLKEWAVKRGVEFCPGSVYNHQSNKLSERLIRDLKMFKSMYPSHPDGWKKSLAVRHRNYSHCSTIGCSPVSALENFSHWKRRLPIYRRMKIWASRTCCS